MLQHREYPPPKGWCPSLSQVGHALRFVRLRRHLRSKYLAKRAHAACVLLKGCPKSGPEISSGQDSQGKPWIYLELQRHIRIVVGSRNCFLERFESIGLDKRFGGSGGCPWNLVRDYLKSLLDRNAWYGCPTFSGNATTVTSELVRVLFDSSASDSSGELRTRLYDLRRRESERTIR